MILQESSVLPSSMNMISYEKELDRMTCAIQLYNSFKDSSSFRSGTTIDNCICTSLYFAGSFLSHSQSGNQGDDKAKENVCDKCEGDHYPGRLKGSGPFHCHVNLLLSHVRILFNHLRLLYFHHLFH